MSDPRRFFIRHVVRIAEGQTLRQAAVSAGLPPTRPLWASPWPVSNDLSWATWKPTAPRCRKVSGSFSLYSIGTFEIFGEIFGELIPVNLVESNVHNSPIVFAEFHLFPKVFMFFEVV